MDIVFGFFVGAMLGLMVGFFLGSVRAIEMMEDENDETVE